jgi:hypothetical protein
LYFIGADSQHGVCLALVETAADQHALRGKEKGGGNPKEVQWLTRLSWLPLPDSGSS